jgi:hypothetical protein
VLAGTDHPAVGRYDRGGHSGAWHHEGHGHSNQNASECPSVLAVHVDLRLWLQVKGREHTQAKPIDAETERPET